MRICGLCKIEKPIESFNKDKNKALGRAYRCKECSALYAKEWRLKNPDKQKAGLRKNYLENRQQRLEAAKNWRESNKDSKREYNRKRKALLAKVTVESFTDAQVLEAYGTVCYICEKQVNLEAPRQSGVEGWEMGLHIDHVIPISKNGAHSLENVRPTHGICNLQKNNSVL